MDVLLNEDGTKLLQEDGTSFILLEFLTASAVKALSLLGVG